MGYMTKLLNAPTQSTAKRSQKKWRMTNSNGEVDNMKTASVDVRIPCVNGPKVTCMESRTRRSRFPTEVRNPCKVSKNVFN